MERTLKIAFVTSEFVTEAAIGGQAVYLSNLASILASHGHSVYVFTMSDEDSEFVFKKDITVVRVKCQIRSRIAEKFLGNFRISYFLNKKLNNVHKQIHFDIIQFSNLRAIPLLMKRGIPSIIRISCFYPGWRSAANEKFDFENIIVEKKELLDLLSMRKALCLFGPSKVCAKLVSEQIGRSVKVVESPINVDFKAERPAFFDDLLQDKKYFLFFGTLNFIKGLHVVCSIADSFLEQQPDYYIVFMGACVNLTTENGTIDSYAYIDKMITRHRDRVIVLNPIYENKYKNYVIKHACACVMPSRIDNLPNTCIETMALGQIVIGTDGASFEQLIKDGENGFLIERDNPQDLLGKMVMVCGLDDNTKLSIERNACEINDRLSLERIYSEMIDMYNEVVRINEDI